MTSSKVPVTVRTSVYNPFCHVPQRSQDSNIHRSPYQTLYKRIRVESDENIEVIEAKFRKLFCLAPCYLCVGATRQTPT